MDTELAGRRCCFSLLFFSALRKGSRSLISGPSGGFLCAWQTECKRLLMWTELKPTHGYHVYHCHYWKDYPAITRFPPPFFLVHHMACGILVPRPGIKPASPAVEAWSLNHMTTREVPWFPFQTSVLSPANDPHPNSVNLVESGVELLRCGGLIHSFIQSFNLSCLSMPSLFRPPGLFNCLYLECSLHRSSHDWLIFQQPT